MKGMEAIAQRVSRVAGVPVEVTLRGGQSFTFSTDERNTQAADRIAAFMRIDNRADVRILHDVECGSFVYVDIN